MSAARSILRELCQKPLDQSELEQVLLSKYSSSGGDRNDQNALLFPGDQERYAVKMVFDKRHALADILAGPRLDSSELSDLKELIECELLTSGKARVGNWILFAALPTSGYFRSGDDFQILPVPEQAPRANFLLADHPLLLQFRFLGSANPMVEQMRRHARGMELELILSGLVANHIRSDRSMVHRWVVPQHVDGPPRIQPSVIRQVGYV